MFRMLREESFAYVGNCAIAEYLGGDFTERM